jgi:hypothetical protein
LTDRGLAAAQARHDVRDERRVEVHDDEEVAHVIAEEHDVEHRAMRASRAPHGGADEGQDEGREDEQRGGPRRDREQHELLVAHQHAP